MVLFVYLVKKVGRVSLSLNHSAHILLKDYAFLFYKHLFLPFLREARFP